MKKEDILFGRIEFTKDYNNVVRTLSKILPYEEAEAFEIECNVVYDSLSKYVVDENGVDNIEDFSDDSLYSVFKKQIFVVFNNILLKYGIVSNIDTISGYLDIFTVLMNLKINEISRSEYALILNGDYSSEDMLYMLLESIVDEPVQLMERIEVSQLFFDLALEVIATIPTEINIEMVSRAIDINIASESEFKTTFICKQILSNEENIMLSLDLGIDIVNSNIRANLLNYYTEDKLTSKMSALVEIIYTYIFYNIDNKVNLNELVNKENISKKFNITYDSGDIKNILYRITNKIGDK